MVIVQPGLSPTRTNPHRAQRTAAVLVTRCDKQSLAILPVAGQITARRRKVTTDLPEGGSDGAGRFAATVSLSGVGNTADRFGLQLPV